MTVLELKEKRMAAEKRMEAILTKAQNEKRSLAEDEEKEFQEKKAESRSLTDKIDALTQWLAEQKVPETRKQGRKFAFVKAIKAMSEKRSLEDPEAIVNEAASQNAFQPESRAANSILIPMEKRATLQATLAAAGKEDVATDLLDLVTPLENNLIAAQAGCTFLTGLTGNIEIPFYTGTTTAWAGELSEAKDGSGQFKKSLAPLRISGYVDISKQLLIQANDSGRLHTVKPRQQHPADPGEHHVRISGRKRQYASGPLERCHGRDGRPQLWQHRGHGDIAPK